MLYAMKLARKAGIMVSLDLNLRMELLGLDDSTRRTFEQAINHADVVFGTAEEEIIPITGKESAAAGAQYLCGGKHIVIARRGSKGVLVVTPKETFQVPALQTKVVDSIGAGDAFNGGFITACLAKFDVREAARWGNAVALAEGRTLVEAIRFANAAAALSVTKLGAQPSAPKRDEIERMLLNRA